MEGYFILVTIHLNIHCLVGLQRLVDIEQSMDSSSTNVYVKRRAKLTSQVLIDIEDGTDFIKITKCNLL